MDSHDSILGTVLSRIIGSIVQLFSAPLGFEGSVRPKADQLEFIVDHGIKNDKFAGKKLHRSVMLVGTIAYDIAKQNSMELELGSLGENILLDFDPHTLALGTKLYIGDAIVQITEECTTCSHLSIHGNNLPQLLNGHRGVYATILQSGTIANSDTVFKED